MKRDFTDWAYGNNTSIVSLNDAVLKMPVRASIGYYGQEGILMTDKFKRFSSSLNLSPLNSSEDHLSVNLNAKFSQTNNVFADGGAVSFCAFER